MSDCLLSSQRGTDHDGLISTGHGGPVVVVSGGLPGLGKIGDTERPSMDIDAVVAALGERLTADEAALVEDLGRSCWP